MAAAYRSRRQETTSVLETVFQCQLNLPLL